MVQQYVCKLGNEVGIGGSTANHIVDSLLQFFAALEADVVGNHDNQQMVRSGFGGNTLRKIQRLLVLPLLLVKVRKCGLELYTLGRGFQKGFVERNRIVEAV